MLLIDDSLVLAFAERSTREFSNLDDSSTEECRRSRFISRTIGEVRVPEFFSRHFLISAGNRICPSVEGTDKQSDDPWIDPLSMGNCRVQLREGYPEHRRLTQYDEFPRR